jgi:pimeloyl-ACP methyl ester carboxylesterase
MGSVELAYRSWGAEGRPTVVLIHGLGGCASIWEPLAASLAADYYFLAPDLRGHGRSPRPGTYKPAGHLEDFERFITARKIDGHFALIGHFLGGLMAIDYAARHPGQVRGLVALDVNVPPPDWQIQHLRQAAARAHPVFQTREDASAYVQKAFAPRASPDLVGSLVDWLIVPTQNGLSFHFDREVLRESLILDVGGQLNRIECPTLFLRGSESPVMERAAALDLLRRLPKGRVVQVPRAGHHVFLDNPRATSDEVRLFLAEALRAD